MAITQKNLIENMEKTIINELEFLIEMKGYTKQDEKELIKRVRQMTKDYNLLLSIMGIKKQVNISFYTILTDLADQATKKDKKAMKLINLYENKEVFQVI